MTKHLQTLTFTVLFVLAAGAAGFTQEPSKTQPASAAAPVQSRKPLTPLKVQVVVSRYQGDKRISNLPYTLSVNANGGKVSLRMGAQVPVPVAAAPAIDGKQMPAMGPVQYKDVGTNVDCFASTTDDGRFNVNIAIEDASVYTDGQTAQGAPRLDDVPAFRSFRSSMVLLLKDGQSMPLMTATDKISGEVVRVDVTLTVVK